MPPSRSAVVLPAPLWPSKRQDARRAPAAEADRLGSARSWIRSRPSTPSTVQQQPRLQHAAEIDLGERRVGGDGGRACRCAMTCPWCMNSNRRRRSPCTTRVLCSTTNCDLPLAPASAVAALTHAPSASAAQAGCGLVQQQQLRPRRQHAARYRGASAHRRTGFASSAHLLRASETDMIQRSRPPASRSPALMPLRCPQRAEDRRPTASSPNWPGMRRSPRSLCAVMILVYSRRFWNERATPARTICLRALARRG